MKAEDRILSKRYARGYMDLDGRAFSTQQETAAANAVNELRAVHDAISRSGRILLHPLVGYQDKNEVLARLLPKDLALSRAADFSRLLIRENRFYLLAAVIEDCKSLHDAYAGIAPARVASRHLLDEQELRRIGDALSAAFGRKIQLSHTISESLVGGMEIRMGDLLIDATIKGRLERLRNGVLAE